MLKVGKINQLKITRQSANGYYLSSKEDEEVLLPNFYITPLMSIGKTIDVFIYHDSEDRLVASTIYPQARLGEFALLEVRDTAQFGAFVDWGLPKELFVPLKYQKSPFKIGEKRVILVALDEQSGRLIGVEKFGKFMPKNRSILVQNEKVELFILASTPLGIKAIINNRYEGMLYKNEIFEKLEIGDRKDGYIKNVRPDGKIDLSLQPIGESAEFAAQDRVLEILRQNNYKLPYSTKTDVKTIYEIFGVSKKSFKQVINHLREQGLITITDFGIEMR